MQNLFFNFLLGALAAGALTACASATPQTEAVLSSHGGQRRVHEIADVPFFRQTAGYCGPATLAMAMGALGHNVTPEELGIQAYTPGMKGTFQEDMISTSRRQGFMAVRIHGMEALLAEVRANHPVIVFENLAFSWLAQWHYALVFGFDLDNEKIILHSGPDAAKHWDLRRFERSWMLGDYWGLVLLKPGDLSATAGELEHVRSAAALEELGKSNEAAAAYQAIRTRWPDSLAAGVGLANIAYARGENSEALKILAEVTDHHPQSATAWFNLAVAQRSLNQLKAARQSAQKALSLAEDHQEKAEFERSLSEWL